MANKMNMMIAKTHRLSTRLVGMQITTGTLVGVVLSAVQMSAGFLITGSGLINGNALIAFFFVVLGVALALLIERLSLGGLSAIRHAQERLDTVSTGFFDRLAEEKREASELEQRDYERRVKELKHSRKVASCFAGGGMLLSAALGDVFWHRVFESLGVPGFFLALAVALVIGLTFIHAELYKKAIDGVLVEILRDLGVQKAAVAVEGDSMQVDMLEDAFDHVRNDAQARQSAEEKVKRAVVRNLQAQAQRFEQNGGTIVVEADTGSGALQSGNQPLMIGAPRGKFGQHREELRRIMVRNPQISQRELAQHFNVSRSTIGEWQKALRAGV